MGTQVDREVFETSEYERFAVRLRENLAAFRLLCRDPSFGRGPGSVGAELELDLVGPDGRSLFANAAVCETAKHPRVTLEIDRYNLELNARPFALAGSCFASLEQDLGDLLGAVREAARVHGGRPVMIGILPTLEARDLSPEALSEGTRYRALARRLAELRHGMPFEVRIDGEDTLRMETDALALEGANTSAQFHLRVTPLDFAATYNAAQLATGVALAGGCNAPTFLGRHLWDETRIALFRQSVDDRTDEVDEDWRPARVSFGHGWVRSSVVELFEEFVAFHAPMLPVVTEQDSLAEVEAGRSPKLAELRMHAGTVWRWNRPVYDDADGGHLRIELRALPSGPTIVDAIATGAFMIGLTLGLAKTTDRWLSSFTFGQARRNFYRAARFGLDADLLWPCEGGPPRLTSAPRLIASLLPLARQGLLDASVDPADVDRLLAIIEGRVARRMTGARWQRMALDRAKRSQHPEREMLERYLAGSETGAPVHTWPLP